MTNPKEGSPKKRTPRNAAAKPPNAAPNAYGPERTRIPIRSEPLGVEPNPSLTVKQLAEAAGLGEGGPLQKAMADAAGEAQRVVLKAAGASTSEAIRRVTETLQLPLKQMAEEAQQRQQRMLDLVADSANLQRQIGQIDIRPLPVQIGPNPTVAAIRRLHEETSRLVEISGLTNRQITNLAEASTTALEQMAAMQGAVIALLDESQQLRGTFSTAADQAKFSNRVLVGLGFVIAVLTGVLVWLTAVLVQRPGG